MKVLGYNRQRIRGNWKIYTENTRDNCHASLLHEFLVTFGVDRSTHVGGVKMGQEGSSRLFATGLYRDRIISESDGLRFRDKTVPLDTFAVPSQFRTGSRSSI